MSRDRNSRKILFMTQFAILLALEAIFCFVPFLGSIPIGPLTATLMMLPVVVTSLTLGWKAGTAMGFLAGLFSFIYWSFIAPGMMSFVFTPISFFNADGHLAGNWTSLLICFVPRTLGGLFSGLVFHGLQKAFPKKYWLSYGAAGLVGSLTNTALVLGGIALFFGNEYAQLLEGVLYILIGTTVLTSGIPEAIVNMLAAYAICIPLNKMISRYKTNAAG